MRMRRLTGFGLIRRALGCRKGVSSTEFILVAPFVFLLITGVIDLMLVMFVNSLMEGGLRDASRLGRTGFEPAAISREEAIAEMVSNATIGLVDMNEVQIAYTIYPSFEDIGKPEPFEDQDPFNETYDLGEPFTDTNGNGQWDADMGAAGLGGPGDVVLYQISYDWTLLTPLLPQLLTGGSTVSLAASVAVRNEPWATPPPPLGGG
ncbi:MAG: pilus assembly protein [Alphaproteobacteria bacterium]|nr:pilus assembly protein [Alphaproteobacteria bacterium]